LAATFIVSAQSGQTFSSMMLANRAVAAELQRELQKAVREA
jgi:hypothetical protein